MIILSNHQNFVGKFWPYPEKISGWEKSASSHSGEKTGKGKL